MSALGWKQPPSCPLNVKTAPSWRGILPFTHLAREGRMTVTIGRRELLVAFGGAAAAWPLAAHAQQPVLPVVGFIRTTSADDSVKRLELLKEVMPQAARIAILQRPGNPAHPMFLKEIEPAARLLGLAYRIFEARASEDLESSFTPMRAWPAHAIFVLDDPTFIAARAGIAKEAARQRLPLICGFREMTEAGCLFSYSVSLKDMWYR